MTDADRQVRHADVAGVACANPFVGNPFATRDDVVDAVRRLHDLLLPDLGRGVPAAAIELVARIDATEVS